MIGLVEVSIEIQDEFFCCGGWIQNNAATTTHVEDSRSRPIPVEELKPLEISLKEQIANAYQQAAYPLYFV